MVTIRPPDPSIKGRTLMYGPYSSAEATRRYIHLAFRDAHTAIDLTAAHGGFWKPPVPPALAITTNNLDLTSAADLHVDFTNTDLPDDSYDLAVYDPPHLADLGADSIMGRRFGTAMGSDGLDQLVTAGVHEAWRIARVGILVKLADSSHGGEFLQLSRWVVEHLDVEPYFVAHTTRSQLEDGKWKVQRVPRSNGAVYLVWRKAAGHRNFDALYRQQVLRLAKRNSDQKRCASCKTPILGGRNDRLTCSSACRQRLYDAKVRAKGATVERTSTDGRGLVAVDAAGARPSVRDSRSAEVLAGGLRRWLHSGAGGAGQPLVVPAGSMGAAVR